ncbi:MAG: hypothetical protein U0797_20185 [Gemmataceae bacterium]
MEHIDYCAWFDICPAEVAILSTFNFDPAFFESRLLQRSKALRNARRVLVLMDAGQFRLLLEDDRPARWLNRRYLVVPIQKPNGVFHPKLHLLVGPTGADVICGSNNLTAPGCTSNLELAHRLPVPMMDGRPAPGMAHVARKAYRFFERCLDFATGDARILATQWLNELKQAYEWLADDPTGDPVATVDLVHTLAGGDWPSLATLVETGSPERIRLISPFYDTDLALLRRLRNQWPACRVEIHAQHGESNLPAEQLPDACPGAQLFDLRCEGRRLHAKLFAWQVGESVECLVGSANFTTAAWDRRNVEACLRLRDVGLYLDALFGNGVRREPIDPAVFKPGTLEPPSTLPTKPDDRPRVTSAYLRSDYVLHVHFVNPLHPAAEGLRIELSDFQNHDWQRKSLVLSKRVRSQPEGRVEVALNPDSLSGCRGALTVSLTALMGDEQRAGIPCWVIQEAPLTRESPGEAREMIRRQIEQTGQGLITHIEELLSESTDYEVVEYLGRLHIRFEDGMPQRVGQGFRRVVRDPYRPDSPKPWLAQITDARREALWGAVEAFANRHEKTCLRKHARRGNLNGMRNFLDVFATLCGLLWHFYKLQLILEPWQGPRVIGPVRSYLQLATYGRSDCPGYLTTLMENLRGDQEHVRQACDELNFRGHLWAALLIAQRVRWEAPGVAAGSSPLSCLPTDRSALTSSLASIRTDRVSTGELRRAFERYEFTDAEKEQWHQVALGHLPQRISTAILSRFPSQGSEAVRRR